MRWFVCVLLLTGCKPPPPAQLPVPANRSFVKFQNAQSQLCLDVAGFDQHKNGTKVTAWHCNPLPGDPGQDGRWYVQKSDGQFIRIRNKVSDKCLGVQGTDRRDRGKAEVWDCVPGNDDPGQDMEWVVIPDRLQPGYVRIANRASQMCLGVEGTSHGPGARVVADLCEDGVMDILWKTIE